MSERSTPPADALPARWPGAGAWSSLLAGGLPFVASVAAASGYGYWLDAGEFVAASVDLGVSHPPGHPLAALYAALVGLLPVGPWPFRYAVAAALAGALAAVSLERALRQTLSAVWPGGPDVVLRPLAVGFTWLAALSAGWWFQGVRPEVYALQAMLVLFALERLVAFERCPPESADPRPVWLAALALGLALANHHFLALLVFPALAPTAARLVRERGPGALGPGVAAGALGLSTYVYLPLRAHRDPVPNLGDPETLERIWWVVSAQAFQGNAGTGVPQPLWERVADVAVQLVELLHPLTVLAAVAGLYVLLRRPETRPLGVLWGLVFGVHVAARAWLGFVRSNPDAWGYLMPAFAAAAVLAGCLVAQLLAFVPRTRAGRPLLAALLAALALGLGPWQLVRARGRARLTDFTAPDDFAEARVRTLPRRAVVIAHDPSTVFELWQTQVVEGARADLVVVPMPFLTYPGMAAGLVAQEPALAGLLRHALLDGQLELAELQGLAGARPVLLELDVRVPQTLYPTLAPRGLFHRVLSDLALDEDRQAGAVQAAAIYRALYRRLGESAFTNPETRSRLLWRHYMDALFYVGQGMTEQARRAVAAGLALAPETRELRALDAVLRRGPLPGPMDVAPVIQMTVGDADPIGAD